MLKKILLGFLIIYSCSLHSLAEALKPTVGRFCPEYKAVNGVIDTSIALTIMHELGFGWLDKSLIPKKPLFEGPDKILSASTDIRCISFSTRAFQDPAKTLSYQIKHPLYQAKNSLYRLVTPYKPTISSNTLRDLQGQSFLVIDGNFAKKATAKAPAIEVNDELGWNAVCHAGPAIFFCKAHTNEAGQALPELKTGDLSLQKPVWIFSIAGFTQNPNNPERFEAMWRVALAAAKKTNVKHVCSPPIGLGAFYFPGAETLYFEALAEALQKSEFKEIQFYLSLPPRFKNEFNRIKEAHCTKNLNLADFDVNLQADAWAQLNDEGVGIINASNAACLKGEMPIGNTFLAGTLLAEQTLMMICSGWLNSKSVCPEIWQRIFTAQEILSPAAT